MGLSRDASLDDIKAAYKRLCLQYHPDKNREPDAHDKFIKIQEAYQILGDETRKREYDALLELERNGNAELFQFLMNLLTTQLDAFIKRAAGAKKSTNANAHVRKPPDIHLSVSASLDDIYRGATRKLQVKVLREIKLLFELLKLVSF